MRMTFLEELRRRRVFRVGIAYVVAAWILLQVLDVIGEILELPPWGGKLLLVIIIVGFFVTIFVSWAYELTPEGIKRESEVDRGQSITPHTRRKLDRLIIVLLLVALGYFVVDKFAFGPARDADRVTEVVPAEPSVSAAATSADTPSIAVLPFVNMSDDKDYFADGLSEELLNLLAKIPDLKVAGRTSSFAFKGKNEDLRTIGEALSVSHVLEGSVRRSGERLRITAQLIKVDDGYHIWSETYDRQMADIFDIQDEVSQAITDALKLHLSATAERPTENSEAYALYLEALALSIVFGADEIDQGLALLDRAIELDPGFAKAWELKANYYWIAGGWDIETPEAQMLVFDAATKALELDPSLKGARSFAITADPENWNWISEIEALYEFLRAEPDNVNAMLALTYDLTMVGYFNEAIAIADRIIELEPLAASGYHRKGDALSAAGRREEAQAAWLKAAKFGNDVAQRYLGSDQLIAGNDELGADYHATHFQLVGADPEVVRNLIKNARDPNTGKVFLDHWINNALANASNTVEKFEPYIWYLQFGFLDDYFAGVRKLRGDGIGWTDADTLENYGMIFRASGYTRHPVYMEFAETDGQFDLWDQRGAPDHCQKVDGDWVCD
jgi:TolB-like protein